MPSENIKRAIKKGTGELPGVTYEEAIYEGYGPGGVAILIEISSDNKNRTVSEVRNLLTKNGGRMGEAGCVAWMFEKKGQILIEQSEVEEDTLMDLVLESGASDMKTEDKIFEVITEPADFENVRKAWEEKKISWVTAEVLYLPKTTVALKGKEAEKVLRLVEVLDENDDVQAVHANFDIPHDVLEQVLGGG